MFTSAPTKLFVRYSIAGRNESSRMARLRIQSCVDEPRVIDLVRRGHGIRDEDDRCETVQPFADLVLALQLVEQVRDGELVVRVLDLVKARRFGLRRLRDVHFHPVLLAVLLRAPQHALAEIPLGSRRVLPRLAATALRRGDRHSLATEGLARREIEVGPLQCAFATISPSTRVVSADSLLRVWRLSSSSFVARVFLVTARVV